MGYSPDAPVIDNVRVLDVGVWLGGSGIVVTGYGNRLSDVYAGLPAGKAGIRFSAVGACTAGNNLLQGLYIESRPAYGILVDSPRGLVGEAEI